MKKKMPGEIIGFGGHGSSRMCKCGHNEMSHTASVKKLEDLLKKSTKFKCQAIGCDCKNFKDPKACPKCDAIEWAMTSIGPQCESCGFCPVEVGTQ